MEKEALPVYRWEIVGDYQKRHIEQFIGNDPQATARADAIADRELSRGLVKLTLIRFPVNQDAGD